MINEFLGTTVSNKLLSNYFQVLINSFFKILPLKESKEPSLGTYMKSLQFELLGCKELVVPMKDEPMFLSLNAILQRLIDNQECDVVEVKREVFHAISICNKLSDKYSEKEGATE